jgi:hypothetical protein
MTRNPRQLLPATGRQLAARDHFRLCVEPNFFRRPAGGSLQQLMLSALVGPQARVVGHGPMREEPEAKV